MFETAIGSRIYGENPATWDAVLTCLRETPQYVAEEKKFEIMTLVITFTFIWFSKLKHLCFFQQSLGILINLVERSSENTSRLMAKMIPRGNSSCYAIDALVEIFMEKEESARLEEARTDDILDGKPEDHASHLSESIVQGLFKQNIYLTISKNCVDCWFRSFGSQIRRRRHGGNGQEM